MDLHQHISQNGLAVLHCRDKKTIFSTQLIRDRQRHLAERGQASADSFNLTNNLQIMHNSQIMQTNKRESE